VLQPFLMGRAVQVHPLAVILAIGAGALVAGIVGALFAVPLTAVVNVVAQYLAGERGQITEEPGPLAVTPAGTPPRDSPPDVPRATEAPAGPRAPAGISPMSQDAGGRDDL
jgi:hypothetical protein